MVGVYAINKEIYNTIEFITNNITMSEQFRYRELARKKLIIALEKLEETISLINSSVINSMNLSFKASTREMIFVTQELSDAWEKTESLPSIMNKYRSNYAFYRHE